MSNQPALLIVICPLDRTDVVVTRRGEQRKVEVGVAVVGAA
jgi:hypothetical protein